MVLVRRLFVSGLLSLVSGCSGGSAEPAPAAPTWLDSAEGELPSTMSELGLYRLPKLSATHARAVPYVPRYELWSNGSEKERFLLLPPDTSIDNSTAGSWDFPAGSLLFKTFSAPRVLGDTLTGSQPLETRVLRRSATRWDYAVYLWNDAGTDAELTDITVTHPVTVELEGERFDHVVPAKLDCRKCHEAQESTVIGVDELNLSAPLEGGGTEQLLTWHAAGRLLEPPTLPAPVAHEDATTQRVLEYLEGNCTHCHNGGTGASSAFDLRHDVALANLINRETEGEAVAGIRVVPGEPDESALYLALSRTAVARDVQPMPPVGVQRADAAAIALVRKWILELSP